MTKLDKLIELNKLHKLNRKKKIKPKIYLILQLKH